MSAAPDASVSPDASLAPEASAIPEATPEPTPYAGPTIDYIVTFAEGSTTEERTALIESVGGSSVNSISAPPHARRIPPRGDRG